MALRFLVSATVVMMTVGLGYTNFVGRMIYPYPCVTHKACFVVSTLNMDNPGPWGTWGIDEDYCPFPMFAFAFALNIQSYQGNGDDTGLNDVALICSPLNGTQELKHKAQYHDGHRFGTWEIHNCPIGGFLTGVRMKTEPPCPPGVDDTAVDNLAFTCSPNGEEVTGQDVKGGEWLGKWGTWQYCPHGSAICGLTLKTEGINGDNTIHVIGGGLGGVLPPPLLKKKIKKILYPPHFAKKK